MIKVKIVPWGLRLEKLILQCGRYFRQKVIWHW